MRNEDRISITLETLGMFWKKYPDMTLMQIFEVIDNEFKKENLDSYYIKDRVLINKLMEYLDEKECNKLCNKLLNITIKIENEITEAFKKCERV